MENRDEAAEALGTIEVLEDCRIGDSQRKQFCETLWKRGGGNTRSFFMKRRKRKFLFGTEVEDEERERRVIVRMVSYLALGGALL